jgi:hypothetical protein
MASIDNITPLNAVASGNIPVFVEGDNFITSDMSDTINNLLWSSIEENGGQAQLANNYVLLETDVAVESKAGISLDHTFNKAFDLSISFSRTVNTLFAVKQSKIAAIRSRDELNPQTYFDLSISYSDTIGYFVALELWDSNNLVDSYSRAISPYDVSELRIIRAGDSCEGMVKIGNDWLSIGILSGFTPEDVKIDFYIQNANEPVSTDFSLLVENFNIRHVLALANVSAEIDSVENDLITARTRVASPSSGDIFLGFPNGSSIQYSEIFIYTDGEPVRRFSSSVDMAISTFAYRVSPSRSELFMEGEGFTWGDNEFIAEDRKNDNEFINTLWDPVTAKVPAQYFQSGHGYGEDIKHERTERSQVNGTEFWRAKLNHGTFFLRNNSFYLFSDDSVVTRLSLDTTEDGRSIKKLFFMPKTGIPLSISTMSHDVRTGNVVDLKRFSKVEKFTGRIINGIELDTDGAPGNIDTTKLEYIVRYNPNNKTENWRLPVDGAEEGIYTFFLPQVPLEEYAVIFNRKDIFQNRKFVARHYGDADAIYGEFRYGTGVEQSGDYTIDPVTGEVTVWLDQDYIDLGHVSYTFDYPAIIEFNDNYIEDFGSSITNPTPQDLNLLDEMGESNASENQQFRFNEFPLVDTTERGTVDRDNVRVYTYDVSTLTFDTSWTRVESFNNAGPNSRVYIVNSDRGFIQFGDGIKGAIPTKYHKIYAGYTKTIRIEYEPDKSSDIWTGKDVDLNLTKNILDSGFLFISRKDLIPESIQLEFRDTDITALEFTELQARVLDIDGEPVPNVNVEFFIPGDSGGVEDSVVTSNSDGFASTIFAPSGAISSIGNFSHMYLEGADSDTLGQGVVSYFGDTGQTPNTRIVLEEEVGSLAEEVYVFKIYDNKDAFQPYNNETRLGGLYQVYYEYNQNTGQNELIRPVEIRGRVAIFDHSLPQSLDSSQPNYDPDIRGFVIVGRKKVQARARTTHEGAVIESDIASINIEYSPIQKGEWTLPIFPTEFDGSEISTATYITINP